MARLPPRLRDAADDPGVRRARLDPAGTLVLAMAPGLQGFLPQLIATPEYQQGRMAIFLWWDSDVHAPKNGAGGGLGIARVVP